MITVLPAVRRVSSALAMAVRRPRRRLTPVQPTPTPVQSAPSTSGQVTVHTIASRLAAFVVAGVAGYASYSHIYDVAIAAGEHPTVAAVLPIGIDGLIVVGTSTMLADKRRGHRPRWSARLALMFGVAATLAANIASAQPDVTSRLVAAVPAVAFFIAVEVLTGRPGRRIAADTAADVVSADPEVDVPSSDQPSAPRPVRPVAVSKVSRTDGTAKVRRLAAGEDDIRRVLAGTMPRNRDELAAIVRAAGLSVSNAKASELMRELRAGLSGGEPVTA